MKTLQSIIANLLILAFIASCSKKSTNNAENQIPNFDLEKQKLQFKKANVEVETHEYLIDERPYYEL